MASVSDELPPPTGLFLAQSPPALPWQVWKVRRKSSWTQLHVWKVKITKRFLCVCAPALICVYAKKHLCVCVCVCVWDIKAPHLNLSNFYISWSDIFVVGVVVCVSLTNTQEWNKRAGFTLSVFQQQIQHQRGIRIFKCCNNLRPHYALVSGHDN